MGGETQSSQTLLTDTSLRLGSRRKLSYPNGNKPSAVDDEASKDDCMSETNHKTGTEGAGEGNPKRSKKQKRRAASPLQEMPDLSQTQEISSQISPSRSESSSVCLDSPQSSDSTLVEDSQLQKSPIFPLTGCRAAVQVDRLNQDLVETCRNSGFVLCSQNSWTWTQKSAQPKSPTFPQSDLPSRPKSPISIDVDQEGDREAELSPQFVKSPLFSSNTQQEQRFPSAYKHQNAQFIFSSQETLSPSIKTGSSSPNSPVFPKSPGPSNKLPLSDQLGFSDSPSQGQRDPSQDRSTSPVFGLTAAQQRIHTEGPSDDRKDTKSDDLNTVMYLPESEELNEKSRDWNSAETELTSDMTLVWSDEDDVVPVGFPSPVFPGERPIHQAASQNHLTSPGPTRLQQSLNRQTPLLGTFGDQSSSDKLAPPGTSSSSKFTSRRQRRELTQEAAGRVSPPLVEPSCGQVVRYYWGVPFCPRGLDPDTYTQVIMTQMEVYEKSLKQAQRCLLRKAEWGEAVLPQPEKSPSPEVPAGSPQHHIPRRRGLRLRGRRTKEAADSFPAEAKEVEDREDEEELQHEKEEEKNEGDEEQMNTDDCEVCPETQLSNNNSPQDLMMESEAEAEISLQPPTTSSELPEIELILREDAPAGEEPQEEEADASVDERMEINVAGCSADSGGRNEEEKNRRGPHVEEVKDGGPQRSTSPELEPAVVPESPKASIDCPICQASFPANEIEMHAAYCDGEVAVVDERRPEKSLKPRRKRWRRAEGTAAETNQPSNTSRNQEKCYICQKTVPLRDYNRHTELCIQRRAPRSAARGNLLSALEQTESRNSDARPSGSRVQPEDVIDLRDDDDDDDEEEATSAFRISNSPIRSFTPISEATDCLIDFKKHQQAKKPSQRRR
ncbi:fibrous sheath CABYR-binding protein [Melanotaenia boesemani]|uniref:fibrous sheath CABYR-binding protein n=1 Tax=Melanotaenia boesemani TaxID=1250792 RepID=UPI001C04AD82|nr:fibrous sheath CABYR-binding protein [Melanotaenia boesemani]